MRPSGGRADNDYGGAFSTTWVSETLSFFFLRRSIRARKRSWIKQYRVGKMQCLCESPTQLPCTTEVFQREVVTNAAELREWISSSSETKAAHTRSSAFRKNISVSPWTLFLFCIGLATGAMLNLLLTKSRLVCIYIYKAHILQKSDNVDHTTLAETRNFTSRRNFTLLNV